MPDLTDTIETNAGTPQSVSGDAGSVTMPSLRDLIEADRYLKSNAAAAEGTKRGLVLTKLQPPGTA